MSRIDKIANAALYCISKAMLDKDKIEVEKFQNRTDIMCEWKTSETTYTFICTPTSVIYKGRALSTADGMIPDALYTLSNSQNCRNILEEMQKDYNEKGYWDKSQYNRLKEAIKDFEEDITNVNMQVDRISCEGEAYTIAKRINNAKTEKIVLFNGEEKPNLTKNKSGFEHGDFTQKTPSPNIAKGDNAPAQQRINIGEER